MFVDYEGGTYVGRFVEGNKDIIELFAPCRVSGFEKVKTVKFFIGKIFSSSKYRKVVPIDKAEKVYEYTFRGQYLGEIFSMVGMGSVSGEYDYRLDTYFDSDKGNSSYMGVLITNNSVKGREFGFLEEDYDIWSKVIRVDVLDKIFIVTRDCLSGERRMKEISVETYIWYLSLKYRLGY